MGSQGVENRLRAPNEDPRVPGESTIGEERLGGRSIGLLAELDDAVKRDPLGSAEGFAAFDPLKTETDFQLQQALVVARAMAESKRASN